MGEMTNDLIGQISGETGSRRSLEEVRHLMIEHVIRVIQYCVTPHYREIM